MPLPERNPHFRPTCPRCCYRCEPRSVVCCECGAALGFTVEQLREISYEASLARMNHPEPSDRLLTDGNPRGSALSVGSSRGRDTR